MFNEAIKEIVEDIKHMVLQMLENAKFDKSYFGYIEEVNNSRNPYVYTVRINGAMRTVKSNLFYEVGDIVLVTAPLGNWDSARIIFTGGPLEIITGKSSQ